MPSYRVSVFPKGDTYPIVWPNVRADNEDDASAAILLGWPRRRPIRAIAVTTN